MISNWTKYHMPFEKLSNFTRHTPDPSDEVKSTYIDGLRRRPRKRDRKTGVNAIEALQKAHARL